ncbi:MAG: hypothetical protein IH596_06695 [Bacteroidales bacterium]|nr:hypothetical protein [Bacteroidales bacterium]
MKKLVLISGMILAIIFITGQSNAQTEQSQDKTVKAQTTQTTPGNFIDKNGDGICDNHQAKGKNANCAKFVDGNGDGVCDNCKGTGNCGQGNCCGKGMQKGNCQGMNKADCCGKGKGHQHRQGMKNCQKQTTPQPEKK